MTRPEEGRQAATENLDDLAPQEADQGSQEANKAPQDTGQGSQGADLAAQIEQEAGKTFRSKMPRKVKISLVVVVIAAFFVSCMMGRYAMNPVEVVQVSASYLSRAFSTFFATFKWPEPDSSAEIVLFNIRFPRTLVVILVGAALATAGASYQGMFKNPLTSPDLLGASAGASLGACLALLLDMPNQYVQLFAFLGGLIAVGMAVWLNRMVDYDPTLGLVLAGILVSTLFQSGMSLIKFMADADDKLPTITFWLMGSFNGVTSRDLLHCLPFMLLGFVLLQLQSWKLNVLSFGDEEARSLGINTKRTRLIVIFASTLITSVSVAVAGIVGWIGLVVPHLARAIVGPNYKVLLPTSMFVGAVFLLLVDDIARTIAGGVEVPIGILTAILGVPFFVVIFRRNMKGWR